MAQLASPPTSGSSTEMAMLAENKKRRADFDVNAMLVKVLAALVLPPATSIMVEANPRR